MARYRIDERTADRLLSGKLSPNDAPNGLAPVAEIVRKALSPASPSELAHGAAVISMAAVVSSEAGSSNAAALVGTRNQRRNMLTKLLTAKAAAAATAAALGLGTAAAAATGSLPGQGASHASSTAVDVLAANGTTNDGHGGGNSKSPIVIGGVSFSATGPGNGHAVPGLCSALESQFAQDPNSPSFTHAKPFKTLISKTGGTPAAANTWCKANTSAASRADGTETETPDTDANQPPGTGAPNSHAPSSTPPVQTPNTGGTGTANNASGGASGPGTSTADGNSGGHSSAGSGNASGH
jgi:hypothetical protein